MAPLVHRLVFICSRANTAEFGVGRSTGRLTIWSQVRSRHCRASDCHSGLATVSGSNGRTRRSALRLKALQASGILIRLRAWTLITTTLHLIFHAIWTARQVVQMSRERRRQRTG